MEKLTRSTRSAGRPTTVGSLTWGASEQARRVSNLLADLHHADAAVRTTAIGALGRIGRRHDLRHVAPLLLDSERMVRNAALRVADQRPFAEAFPTAWQLYRERARFALERREQLLALAVAFRSDPDLALYVFAGQLGKRVWFAPGRRALRECQQQIVHTLASCPHPAGRAALEYHAHHASGRVRRLCRLALARCGRARRHGLGVQPRKTA